MSDLGHLMILASAGSGKTYALTTRFVRLLAAGAPPERVVALTFTRKAAGEFFDEILNRLAGAARDEAAAKTLAAEIERPELAPAEFRSLLRQVVDAMPRLNLGTLDGFFSRLVQAFPLELGLGGDFELLEEAQARRERQRVLSLLFNAGVATDAARQDFIEAFKRATYGVEEKALQQRLDSFLNDHGETYLQAPDAACWGNARRVWPEGNPWLESGITIEQAVTVCRAALPWSAFNDKQRGVLAGFLLAMEDWEVGAALPKPANTPVGNILKYWDALLAGTAEMPVGGKKVAFEPDAGRALAGVVGAIMAAELNRKIEVTRGIHAVVQLYEERYDKEVRRAGRLTFADVQRLLQPSVNDPVAAQRRMLMDWRLDARFDHWLLDEFQDTSREQWRILHNLVDEAVQDPEGGRSFFYVGDVKQAIYGWRGGDARLFREIFDHYNQGESGAIKEQHLARSWRSCAPIIEMVNAVCGDGEALAEIVPDSVVTRWMREWEPHATARVAMTGHAALHWAEDETGRWAETLRILQSIDAAERGLTVAVLVQTNRKGAELAEYLRAEGGVAALAESDLHVAFDNPFTCALLALLRVAAHPGDRFARESVAMTPVQARLVEFGWSDGPGLSWQVLCEVHEEGFAGMFARWVQRLEPALHQEDEFSRMRARQLVDAARAFDDTGSRDIDEFLEWVELHTLREVESPGVVRVMTVHKAKGLGFDVVVLPDLQGNSVALRRSGLAIHRDAEHEVDWVLDPPTKLIAENDPVLLQQFEADQEVAGYEALCKLYVALTRAKRALHVIVEPVGKRTSRNFPKLMSAALGESWERGDPNWFAAEEAPVSETILGKSTLAPISASRRRVRRTARTPSGGESVPVAGRHFFAPAGDAAADRGQAIHRLLALVSWANESEMADLRGKMAKIEQNEDWLETAFQAVAHPDLSEIFRRPEEDQCDLWRERAFEVAYDGSWITGVFDRVVIRRDRKGHIIGATVIDFKTDAVGSEGALEIAVDRHRPQLKLYREVVARMIGLPAQGIVNQLVFIQINQAVRVE
ncbi:MAG: UvrD-helicase domain-containing protein [Opitutaceae bacterium]|nr:UvrD-helicase domain-containing protein [Opitutaceae bacterium]